MQRIYLDNAATTPIDPQVIVAMTDTLTHLYGNPSSIHADGRNARAAVEEARKKVAKLINASIGEVFFTSGGTESNNMVLKNAVRDLGVRRIVSSKLEHHAVLHTLDSLVKMGICTVDYVHFDKKGQIDIQDLEEILRGSTDKTLVTLMHSNNEIGTMIDLDQVAQLCKKYNALFHSDTVQTLGFYPIDVQKTKVDFLNGSAHKFHGPKGIGFVYINGDAALKPFIDGGSQERNMRGGTENISGIIGLAKALELAYADADTKRTHVETCRNYLKTRLLETFEDIEFIGDTEGGHFKVLNVSFPSSPKAELLLFSLDIAGISASGGSACSSGAERGSHVLEALQIDPSRKSIRFSFSHLNTLTDVDFVIEKLKKMTPLK
ncbi:MAG: cysteine desulfurase family protein [Saprospiraceae bacterium]|nr:cysteine desulfurase family protein [Saprospiraceae bacterium]